MIIYKFISIITYVKKERKKLHLGIDLNQEIKFTTYVVQTDLSLNTEITKKGIFTIKNYIAIYQEKQSGWYLKKFSQWKDNKNEEDVLWSDRMQQIIETLKNIIKKKII